MATLIDRVGKRYGRLLAVRYFGSKKRRSYWLCRCDCGTETVVAAGHLRSGHTTSCGCLKDDKTRARSTTHGCSTGKGTTAEYRSWREIKTRCTNPNKPGFSQYGGRGIRMCDRWLNSFEAFLADMGPRPSPAHSIDRIDNDGNYEPGNCRWATRKEQILNRQVTVRLTFRGHTRPLKEWADELGLNYHTLYNRLTEYGWSVERALSEPTIRMSSRKRKSGRFVKGDGQ